MAAKRLDLDALADAVERPTVGIGGRNYRIKVQSDLSPNDLGNLTMIGRRLTDMPDASDGDAVKVWLANVSAGVSALFYDDVSHVDFGAIGVDRIVRLCGFFTDAISPPETPPELPTPLQTGL